MVKEAFVDPGFLLVGVDFLHNLAYLAVHLVLFPMLLSHLRAFTKSEAALSFVERIAFALLVLLLMSLLLFLLVVGFIVVTNVIYVPVFLVTRPVRVLTVRPIQLGRVAFFVFSRPFFIIYLFLLLDDVCIYLDQVFD